MARVAAHEIEPLFIRRWSPRAMSGEPLPDGMLGQLFEAARWAPSSGNNQPWRFVYARRDTPAFGTLFGLLEEGNQVWCRRASVLCVVVSRDTTDKGTPAPTHSFDTGAAWMSLALQGSLLGLVVHGMAGFDYAAAPAAIGLPEGFTVECMIAIGLPGSVEELPPQHQAREQPNDRKPVESFAFEARLPPGP